MSDIASRIVESSIEEELGVSFGRYARATILARAIPDVRDGLKPVQRRIIYAMYLAKNNPDQRYRKCAKTVGEVMGSFHPHGDSSIYDALVRLAQDWKMRLPLVDGHGNFGSIDDDPPAAMRYTEARLAPLAIELTRDIEKDTVAYQPNFDDSEIEPTVLPAKFPNLLVNGTSGVSTGFATEIPPHNLGECMDALVAMIDTPDLTLGGIMRHIKGPDFPTGGLLGIDDLQSAYETGKGRVILRGRTEIEKARDGRARIVVSEIPYGVVKSNLVRDLERMRTDKVVQGISDVRDETDREGLRIVIDLQRGVEAEPVLAFLLKKTDLQVYRHFQMVAIVDKTPRLLGLKEILEAYLEHQRDVVLRRSRHDLDRAERRLHLVEGLIKAIDVLDEVIATIRAAKDRPDAHEKLMARFDFSDLQTKEILDLRLHRLTNLQILQLRDEEKALKAEIAKLKELLGSYDVLMATIRAELLAVKAAHADPRRTTVMDQLSDIDQKIQVTVTVKEQPVMVGVSRDGYIKRSGMTSFEKSGGEIAAAGVKEDDLLRWPLATNTLHHVAIFTAQGKVFTMPVHELPEARWTETGTALVNVVAFDKDDSVVTAMSVVSFDTDEEICFVTRAGSVKRTALKDLQSQRSTGLTCMKLSADDEVLRVMRTDGSGHILISTRMGYSIRFPMSEISTQGRGAGGVRGMRLASKDRIVDAVIVPGSDDGEVGVITEEGKGKRTPLDQFPTQRRGGRGVRNVRQRQRLPHRVAVVPWWSSGAANTEELRLFLSDNTEVVRKVAELSNAARDGNGYEYVSPAVGGRVIDGYALGNAPDPHAPPPPPEPPAPEPMPLPRPPSAGDGDDGRGGWAKKEAFLPGFAPPPTADDDSVDGDLADDDLVDDDGADEEE